MKFADPVDFSQRMAVWVARTVGAHVAGLLCLPGVKKDMAALHYGAPAAHVRNMLSGLSMRASGAAGAAAAAEACSGDGISASADLAAALVAAADSAELAAEAAVDAAADGDPCVSACHSAGHSFDAANSIDRAGNGEPAKLFGLAMVHAWTSAGGDFESLRRPGINQLLVQAARKDGLDMSDWHCGTAHCIAGWYSTLSGHPGLELTFSCWFSAALVFAVNNPGEPLPYMGHNQRDGLAELVRLEKLNRAGNTSQEEPV